MCPKADELSPKGARFRSIEPQTCRVKESGKHRLRGQLRKKSLSPDGPLGRYASYEDYLAYQRRKGRELSVKERNHRLLLAYYVLIPDCRVHIAEPWWDTPDSLQREPRNLDDIRAMYFRRHMEAARKLARYPSGRNQQAQWQFLARAGAGFDLGYSPSTSEQVVRTLLKKRIVVSPIKDYAGPWRPPDAQKEKPDPSQ